MEINKALLEERRKIDLQLSKLYQQREAINTQIVKESAPVRIGDKVTFRPYLSSTNKVFYGIVVIAEYVGDDVQFMHRNPDTVFRIQISPCTKHFVPSKSKFGHEWVDEKCIFQIHP